MRGWLWLVGAIAAEVSATTALRSTEGFTRLWPTVAVVTGYGLAFASLSRTLDHLPLGLAYAVWSGVGTLGAVLAGWALYGERLGWQAALGVGFVMTGTALLHSAQTAGP